MEILRKQMVVCTPFGKYVNGDYSGTMSKVRLQKLVANFTKYPRQVPIYALGDHVDTTDDRPLADGWVEGLSINDAGELVADVKLHGIAAEWVANDQIRGASIGTVIGNNPDGSEQGEVLQHLLLTNNPFDKSLNIAAARLVRELVAAVFTALPPKEAEMADEKDQEIIRLREENAALKAQSPDEKTSAQLTETRALLAEKTREVADLTASNSNLKADVERFKSPKAIEELQLQLKAEQRKNRAAEVRRKVAEGVEEGQFSREMVGDPKSGYRHPSDEMVLTWFRESVFKDDMQRLDIMLETMPKKRLNRTFGNGMPNEEAQEASLSAATKNDLRLQGQDPDAVEAAMKAADSGSFIAQQKSKKAS